jgi:hypothetical protein
MARVRVRGEANSSPKPGFNLLMFACDVAKYVGNCKEGAPSAALAAPSAAPDAKQKGA